MLKRFGFIKPSSGLYDGKKIVAWTMMDVFIKIMGQEKVYIYRERERLVTIQLEFFFENYYVIGKGNLI